MRHDPTRTEHLTANKLDKELRRWGVHKGYPAERAALAAMLCTHDRPMNREILERLFRECKEGRMADNPPAMLRAMLDDGSWAQLWDDIAAEEEVQTAQHNAMVTKARSAIGDAFDEVIWNQEDPARVATRYHTTEAILFQRFVEYGKTVPMGDSEVSRRWDSAVEKHKPEVDPMESL